MAFPPPGFMFQSLHEDQEHLPTTSLNNLTSQYHGGVPFMMKRSMSFSCLDNHGDDELSDDGSQLGEKKKRLNLEQVKALEKSFELGNKLEPERKMQLAKALGLQPRQIAIWFQNRRARWKTKQLEKDYEGLKKQFQALKEDNEGLHAQNKKLNQELMSLKGRGTMTIDSSTPCHHHKKEKEYSSWSNGSDISSSDINLEISRKNPVMNSSLSSQNSRILHGLKLDQMVQDENFCNMFNSVEEQQHNFWPWAAEQQHFH